MSKIRQPAVAGMFYPDNRERLKQEVQGYLSHATSKGPPPKAIIVPHAGYIYSGPVAAFGYALLRPVRRQVRRVIMLGPAHRVAISGIAVSTADEFLTPLGPVLLDSEAIEKILTLPQVMPMDEAHRLEHCLEVQLPFLQSTLEDFRIVPLVVGDASPAEVLEVLDLLWGGQETLILISSDLSHFHDYETAKRIDHSTTEAIESLDSEAIADDQACGRIPIKGLLLAARKRGLRAHILDERNSGDTAGPRDRVVGYGAYAID